MIGKLRVYLLISTPNSTPTYGEHLKEHGRNLKGPSNRPSPMKEYQRIQKQELAAMQIWELPPLVIIFLWPVGPMERFWQAITVWIGKANPQLLEGHRFKVLSMAMVVSWQPQARKRAMVMAVHSPSWVMKVTRGYQRQLKGLQSWITLTSLLETRHSSLRAKKGKLQSLGKVVVVPMYNQ